MEISCPTCGSTAQKEAGGVNRSRRKGSPVYCSKDCASEARRLHKSDQQKRAEKAKYDADYRAKNQDRLKIKSAEYHRKNYDPEKARAYRKTRMHKHVEYCRKPEYRAKKAQYDKTYRAVKQYGEYAECFLIFREIERECLSRKTRYELDLENGRLGKTQKRRRDYERLNSKEPQIGALGDFKQP